MKNNKNMTSPYFSILLVFLLISVLQLSIKAKINFNLQKNLGEIQLKFLGITVFFRRISFGKKYIKLTNKKGKNQYLPIEMDKQSIENYANFQEILFKKIYAKQLLLYFNFGVKDSPFLTSMICGYVDIISKILFCVLKTKKNEVVFKSKIYPSFEKSLIKFQIKAKISLSLYDLIWSFAEAKLQGKALKLKAEGLEKYGI